MSSTYQTPPPVVGQPLNTAPPYPLVGQPAPYGPWQPPTTMVVMATDPAIAEAQKVARSHAIAAVVMAALCNVLALTCAIPAIIYAGTVNAPLSKYQKAKKCAIAAIVISSLTCVSSS